MKIDIKARLQQNRGRYVIFTLIELLFVITIIMILGSLLLPAMQKAKDSAKMIDCRGKMRQNGIAARNYSEDNNSWVIPYYFTAEAGTTFWSYQLMRLKYLPDPGVYSGMIRYFTCPGERNSEVIDAYTGAYWRGTHYGINRYLSLLNVTMPPYGYTQFSSIKNPSSTYFLGDHHAMGDSTFCYPQDYPEAKGRFNLRHLGRGNILYCDLHADSQKNLATVNTSSWNGR